MRHAKRLPASPPALAIALAIALAALPLCAPPAVAATCPSPPPPVRDLEIPRYYTDISGTRIDPGRKALHAATVAPLKLFLKVVSSNADRALKDPRRQARHDAALCTLSWLDMWAHGGAKGGAWLGRMVGKQSEYQRKWDLAGTALAYLKVKPYATPAQRRRIEPWLDRIAVEARRFFDDPRRKRNNHWYWLGLALGGTALATGNEAHWIEARRIMADAGGDIRADGALPMELTRGSRALHYHAFAATPLVILAELAAARGEDWYKLNDGALHRLLALTAKGFADPATFERLTGAPQTRSRNSADTLWLPLYRHRFPERLSAVLPAGLDRAKAAHRWTGGDVMLLMEFLRRNH